MPCTVGVSTITLSHSINPGNLGNGRSIGTPKHHIILTYSCHMGMIQNPGTIGTLQ